MEKVTLEDGQSANIVSENIEKLIDLLPDAFTEAGVNFDVLRQLLGDASILDQGEEKYGLNWHGKKKARQIALTPSTGTLLPCPEESVDWDTTQNLIIEGDNLEALKLLQKSYANKVRMIYIDPPYNTGKEFIYPDKFKDNLETYLRYTNQIDSEGIKLSSNTEVGGRKHTNWFNMIYPRLRVAKSLLRKDGMIFVSIDDNEVANLKIIMDELFGSENFVDIFSWQKTTTPANLSKLTKKSVEYIIAYQGGKVTTLKGLVKNSKSSNGLLNQTNKVGTLTFPANVVSTKLADGIYPKGDYGTKSYDIELHDDTEVKNGVFILPVILSGKFKWSQGYLNDAIDSGVTVSIQTNAFSPAYSKDEYEPEKPWNIINKSFFVGTNENASAEVDQLFHTNFSEQLYPKPTSLLKYLINTIVDENDIVLDFFAGSATTGDAIYQLNSENNRSLKFILIQLPEITAEDTAAFKAGLKTIADVAKERLRRVESSLQKNDNESLNKFGFKVFKLAQSNVRAWNPDKTNLEETLQSHKDHLVEGRSEQDVLYELLLKRGIELTVPIEEKQAEGKTIFSIGAGVLFACLDTSIKANEVDAVAQGILDWHNELEPETDTHVFFRDSAFDDDIAKTNMVAILEQNGIHHVRSL